MQSYVKLLNISLMFKATRSQTAVYLPENAVGRGEVVSHPGDDTFGKMSEQIVAKSGPHGCLSLAKCTELLPSYKVADSSQKQEFEL